MKKIIILVCVFLTACASVKKQPESWEVNELFTQLSELRKEIKLLKSDVQGLKLKAVKKNSKSKGKQTEIDLSSSFPLGKETAKYAIVEFTDYQCPYCLKHRKKTLPIIKQQYIDSGVIKYFIKDFPLEFHSQAKNAAMASQCAGQQGKFWDMHGLIFDNNKKLSKQSFSTFANEMDIDLSLFQKCMASEDTLRIVENNIAEGDLIGVRGTPAFFIGRVKGNKLTDIRALYGAQSFLSFSRVINGLINE